MTSFSDLWTSGDHDAIQAALLRLGFAERPKAPPRKKWGVQSGEVAPPTAGRAEQLIASLTAGDFEKAALLPLLDDLISDLVHSADPLRALLNFSRFADSVPSRADFYADLSHHPEMRFRLTRLLGFSQALSDTLTQNFTLLELLRNPAQAISRPALRQLARQVASAGIGRTARLDALRAFRREQTLRIALLDMERQTWRRESDFALVVRQISDLAQVVVQTTLEVLADDFDTSGFLVLALGKLGARELNYWSDLDLIFVSEGDPIAARVLGEALLRELNLTTQAGTLYRVDMRLRPDGSSGALVTPFGYALSYYESYAAAWEWQALIKCRALAGEAKLARRFRRFTSAITWARRADDGHLRDVVAMKKRSEATPDGSDETNVKQGPGGIRDVEWIVQQLQMMTGPAHRPVRVADTLGAIRALQKNHTLTAREARELREGYLFLRVVEHRLQLLDERPIRTLPSDPHERGTLARRLGHAANSLNAATRLDEDLKRHRSEIRALCENLFWGWREEGGERGSEVVRSWGGDENSPPHHPATSQPHRIATGGPTHPFPAPLARQIGAALPDVLHHVEHAANPQRALLNLERLCDASGNRLSLLRSLGAAPEFARAVLAILGGSSLVAETLIAAPELLDLVARRELLDEPVGWDQARAECRAYCLTFRDRSSAVRRWRKRELLRIALRDLALNAPPHELTAEISHLAQACLAMAVEESGAATRPASDRVSLAVLGMGKLGGGEMHYGSDCDVIFVSSGEGEIANAAARWAETLIRFMNEATEDGPCFHIDARLRPHGQSGALAPSLAAFHEYFEDAVRGVSVWERQALTRARHAVGDISTGAALVAAIREVAFPAYWNPAWSDELRHIKQRVENERAAKSRAAMVFDVKLGSGALSDIEWCAQWLAMKNGAIFPSLQTPNTRRQISAAGAAGLLSDEKITSLLEAHTFLRRAELRLQLTQEHGGHAAQVGTPEFTAWARAVFPDEETSVAAERIEEQWKMATRKSRDVMERVRDGL